MSELRGTECLSQYDLDVISFRRGRGAVLCETSQGLMLLKECAAADRRVQFEDEVLSALKEKDGIYVDDYRRTSQGELLSQGADGSRYLLKRWYGGGECDMRSTADILAGVRQLARLHLALRGLSPSPLWEQRSAQPEDMALVFERHNREFRRVRAYVKRRQQKNDFELLLAASFEDFYSQAQEAAELMAREEARGEWYLCHGDFSNHHILIGEGRIAVTEFGRLRQGVQIWDLYYFMRKALEKHGWSLKLGRSMLEAYSRILPVDARDADHLCLLFLYPEKYWKQLNYYYNSNKAWIPERNVDKLRTLVRQQEARRQFIEFLRQKSFLF